MGRRGSAPNRVYVVRIVTGNFSPVGFKKKRRRKLENKTGKTEIHFGNKDSAYYNTDETIFPKYHWSLLSISEKEFYLNYKEKIEQVQTIGEPGNLEDIPEKILNFNKKSWKQF